MRIIGCLLLATACTASGCTVGPVSGTGSSALPAAATLADVEHESEPTARTAPGVFDPDALHVERQPWHFHGTEGEAILTPNFKIYTTLRSRRMLRALPLFYESCLVHYMSELGDLPAPAKRMESFVFSDARQWRNKTRELLPEQADAFMTLGRGGFTTRGSSVLYFIGGDDTYAIAAHEGWHQYTQTTFSHALPVWLEEGIATYMEAVSRGHDGRTRLRPWDDEERRDALAKAARDGDLIPIEELLTRTPQSFLNTGKNRLLVYYAQVWAITRFLVEGEGGRYRGALSELLSDAAEGRLVGRLMKSKVAGARRGASHPASRGGPAVVAEYFNSDLAAFSEEYDQFMAGLIGVRGPARSAIEATGAAAE